MSDGTPTITFDGAGKCFGDDWALRDVDLDIRAGSIVGLIGPSGCGKTTTVRLANGAYRPDEGEVHLMGRPPSEMGPSERLGIGYLPQQPALFDDLSLWENLNFHASLNGVRFRRRDRLVELLEFVELAGDEKKLVREASGGMQRRLALAATLVHRPPVLLLDEPTAGIDPILRRRFWERFRELREDGRTLVVATQYVGEAADCDVVVLLARGRVVAVGTPDELRRQAFGGEQVDIEVDRRVDGTIVERFERMEAVHSVDLVDPHRVRLVVDDASVALPTLLAELEGSELRVVDAGEVAVDYDEVFIDLVGDASLDDSAPDDPAPDDPAPDDPAPDDPAPDEPSRAEVPG